MAKYLDLDGLTRYNNKVNAKLDTKADVDGNYEDMAVGQLLSNTFEEDKAPYNFRTSGGTLEIGDREYDTLVGGTVAFNQLIQPKGAQTSVKNQVTVTHDGNGKISLSGTASANTTIPVTLNYPNYIVGHIYYLKGCPSGGSNSTYSLRYNSYGFGENGNGIVVTTVSSGAQRGRIVAGSAYPNVFIASGQTLNMDFYPQIFDLTQMFGSTIADYIYSLEQATAGSGVAYFRSLFPKDYYAYNAGQLMSVKALSHKMTGFNQWGEEWLNETKDINTQTGEIINSRGAYYFRTKNYIPVFPNTVYYNNNGMVSGNYRFFFYDKNKAYISYISTASNATLTTPTKAYYMLFRFASNSTTTYQNNICINLHWDGERDGEYEAYEEHIYPLDSDLELRGIPKLDANNNLYYDGDTYESDGTVTRKYGVVDLGTQTWTKSTSGNFTFFYTPVSGIKRISTSSEAINLIVFGNYKSVAQSVWSSNIPCVCKLQGDNNNVLISDHNFDDKTGEQVATALNGTYLVYELATPTTETADTFENPQLVDNWGTEEYTDSREVQIPVGHITKYPPDLKAKLESAPDSPASDGDYILRHNNGENSYVALTKELPAVPTTDGTYVLKATVLGGVATLSWVAE